MSLWVFFWSVSDVFGVTAGAANYLDVAAGLGIMAVAVSLLMIGGEFDLSAGSLTGATAMLVILLGKPPGPSSAAPACRCSLPSRSRSLFALGIGYFNATMVERTGLPSFIVTLGSFFVLIGAKLGFAKLFTDKVIVEGLDEAAGYDFWVKIFGAIWVRNEHILESRDLIYAVLLIVGAVTLIIGVYELSFRRRTPMNVVRPGGAPGRGRSCAYSGCSGWWTPMARANNWIYGAVVAVGVLIGILGLGAGGSNPIPIEARCRLTVPPVRMLLIGLAAIAAGSVAAVLLDSDSSDVIGFLITVQGLRAILFVGLVVFGLGMLFAAARRAGRTSRRSEFAMSIVDHGWCWSDWRFSFSPSPQSPKFRTGMFAALLLVALINSRNGVASGSFRNPPAGRSPGRSARPCPFHRRAAHAVSGPGGPDAVHDTGGGRCHPGSDQLPGLDPRLPGISQCWHHGCSPAPASEVGRSPSEETSRRPARWECRRPGRSEACS